MFLEVERPVHVIRGQSDEGWNRAFLHPGSGLEKEREDRPVIGRNYFCGARETAKSFERYTE